MNRFRAIFNNSSCNIIGMLHINALPGTPNYAGDWAQTIEKVLHEANIYNKHKLDAVLIENMHDIPYVPERQLGPETVACMTRLAATVRAAMPQQVPCGVQVLAFGNKQALAVAKAAGLQFIRAESYVFGHIADEGYTNACAGELLRYRRSIDAQHVLIFSDIKKKHSSHALTSDVDLLATARAAEFFLADGLIITGTTTGQAAKVSDVQQLTGQIETPLLIGSGVTCDNIKDYYEAVQAIIIGSHFKRDGCWSQDLSEDAVHNFMSQIGEFKQKNKNKKTNCQEPY